MSNLSPFAQHPFLGSICLGIVALYLFFCVNEAQEWWHLESWTIPVVFLFAPFFFIYRKLRGAWRG